MNKILIFSLFILSGIFTQTKAQTYGNWSGILHTQSVPVTENGNPDFHYFTPKIQEYLKQHYKGKYIKLITYVVKQGQRYTISIKYPQDGIDRSVEFIGYDPYNSRGFSISYQNRNKPGTWWVNRINVTNSQQSTTDRTVVVVSTNTPSAPFHLRIQYPAVPDNVVDSRLPNPGDPKAGEFFWGTIVKEPILMIR
ncbi:MAG: hypothetical protein GXO47_11895 [Chlorobi bacterium]|nr:hypothetical protein [Chlorobiota bacterium]